jgi:hypothetical protein
MASESPTSTANGFLSFLGIAVLLVVVTIVAVAVLAVTGSVGETLEQKRAKGRIAVRMKLEQEAQARINSEGWVDKAKGLVYLKVADAIPLAIADLQKKHPAPSQVKVEPPIPIILPPPNSKEPPPPLLPSQGTDMIRFTPPGTPVPAAAAVPAAAPARAAVPAAPAPAAPASAPAPVPINAGAIQTHAVAPAPAPAPQAKPAPAAPARPPIINPTENPAPTK